MDPHRPARPEPWTCHAAVWLAAVVGVGLMVDSALRSSATYDEVAYLRVAARWWRTGDQDAITRMGSPLTFWKLQQVPVLWTLDRLGLRALVDDPLAWQALLLPVVRIGSLWIWLAALLLTAAWARLLYGPKAMALAAWLFALSPNLLAHGSLVTMELPILAAGAAVFLLFWQFLKTGRPMVFLASAAVAGLALSCKFTAAAFPPILAVAWWVDRRLGPDRRRPIRLTLRVACGMALFVAVMLTADVTVTGFAFTPISERTGTHPALSALNLIHADLARWVNRAVECPIPQDWVGFATQLRHQRGGGPSYLLGQRRMTGWWYYYLVALAVKIPLTFGFVVIARAAANRSLRANLGPDRDRHDAMLPLAIGLFLLAASVGSSRNYGVRYLLPLAPLAIVWVSALAESRLGWAQVVAMLGLLGQAGAVASIHPHELSYFNALAGGPEGGRRILADSNLDWGQGARALARLQAEQPEYFNLTVYYFGDTDTNPARYGVFALGPTHVIDAADRHPGLPPALAADTEYVAVSASLQWGPWGPPGYFLPLDGVPPVALTDDRTIAIYRASDIPALKAVAHSRPPRGAR